MNELAEIQRALGRIEAEVGAIKGTLDQHVDRDVATDGRLRKVENRQYWFTGVGTGIGAGIGAALTRWLQHQA